MIVSATIQKLEASPGVTQLLAFHPKATGKHAIYANSIPQASSHPLIVIDMLDDEPQYHLGGDPGLAEALIEIEIQTDEKQGYGKLEAIKEQVRLALAPTGGAWGSLQVQECHLSALRDEDFEKDKSDIKINVGGWQASIFYQQQPVEA